MPQVAPHPPLVKWLGPPRPAGKAGIDSTMGALGRCRSTFPSPLHSRGRHCRTPMRRNTAPNAERNTAHKSDLSEEQEARLSAQRWLAPKFPTWPTPVCETPQGDSGMMPRGAAGALCAHCLNASKRPVHTTMLGGPVLLRTQSTVPHSHRIHTYTHTHTRGSEVRKGCSRGHPPLRRAHTHRSPPTQGA